MAYTVVSLLCTVIYTGMSVWFWRAGRPYRRGVAICAAFATIGFVLGITNLATGVFQ